MFKKIIYIFFVILSIFLVGCNNKKQENLPIEKKVLISGLVDEIEIGDEINLSVRFVFVQGNETWDDNYTPKFTVSDRSVVSLIGSKITALKEGSVNVHVIAVEDEDFELDFSIKVLKEIEETKEVIIDNLINTIDEGEKVKLNVSFKSSKGSKIWYNEYKALFESSNNDVCMFEDGVLVAKNNGTCTITVKALKDSSFTYSFSVTVNEIVRDNIVLNVKNNLTAGELSSVDVFGVAGDYLLDSTNKTIAIVNNNYILGLQEGNTTIKLIKDNVVLKSVDVRVNKYIGEDDYLKYKDQVDNIISKMTLEQKVGQMFIGSSSGTTITSASISAINDYHLGNFIFMGDNVTDPTKVSKLVSDLQEKFVGSNGVSGFISIDQETGTVNRMNSGATRFLGNMAQAATNDSYTSYLVGSSVGEELKYYGINFDLCPVLDVNNNPNNPIINCRSYSDDPIKVANFGSQMMKGLKSKNVMSCSKHFPGHGNTSTDSHLALPLISSSLDDLYQIELAPFISAIYNGIDSIMTTHIVFSNIDSKYPATLSYDVLTGLLRNKLGYTGLIVTDGMEMSAIAKNYGKEEAAILAINAGADILCYTSVSDPVKCIPAVLNAINNGTIKQSRIDDAVRRIIAKKIKYDLIDNYLPTSNTVYDNSLHEELNISIARKSVTVVGEYNGLDKSKNTLIISPKSSYDLGYSNDQNSFSYYAYSYLKKNGMQNISYRTAGITSSLYNELMTEALKYEQVVVAIDTADSVDVRFVDEISSKMDNVIVVALKLPYDYNNYKNVKTFMCIYDRTPVMIKALTEALNNEYIPSGVSPIKLKEVK